MSERRARSKKRALCVCVVRARTGVFNLLRVLQSVSEQKNTQNKSNTITKHILDQVLQDMPLESLGSFDAFFEDAVATEPSEAAGVLP